MSKLVINSFEDFEKYVGQPLGESEYLNVSTSLPMPLWTINGFTRTWNVPKRKARSRAPSYTVIWPSPSCPICGTRSSRSTTWRWWLTTVLTRWNSAKPSSADKACAWAQNSNPWPTCAVPSRPKSDSRWTSKRPERKHWRARLSLFIISTDYARIAGRFLPDTFPASVSKTAAFVSLKKTAAVFLYSLLQKRFPCVFFIKT